MQHVVFHSLPRSHDAAFNAAINLANTSHGPCTKDTHVDIIGKIMVWVNETDPVKATLAMVRFGSGLALLAPNLNLNLKKNGKNG